MSQNLEGALNAMYRNYGTRILEDRSFFIQCLEGIYQPEWKADFNLLDKASAAGMSGVAAEFARLGRAPTPTERDRMVVKLMAAAPGLYEKDAARAVSLYAALMGWDAAPRAESPKTPPWQGSTANHTTTVNIAQTVVPGTASGPEAKAETPAAPKQQRAKGNWGPMDVIAIIMIVLGAAGFILGFTFTSQTGMSMNMLFNTIELENAFGGPNFSTAERLLLLLMRARYFTFFGGAALLFASRLLKKK